MVTIEILRAELTTLNIDISEAGDAADIQAAFDLNDNVLAMRLKDSEGTLVICHSVDHYFLMTDFTNGSSFISLQGYDTYEGEHFKVSNPRATDQYRTPFYPPHLIPFKPPQDYWIFEGVLVDSDTWSDAMEIINGW